MTTIEDLDTSTELHAHSDSSQSQSHYSEKEDHSRSSSGGSKRTSSSTDSPYPKDAAEDFAIAREENLAVLKIRIAIALFLTLCTVGVAYMVYVTTKNQEQTEFEDAVRGFSTKVLGSLGNSFDQSLASYDAFVVSTVSFANASNMVWPFVTLPNAGIQLAKVRSVSHATVVAFVPLVSHENKEEWNSFSTTSGHEWVDEALRVQRHDPDYNGVTPDEYFIFPIWYPFLVPANRPEYFPWWHVYPFVPDFPSVNIDIGVWVGSFDLVRQGRVVVTDTRNNPELDDGYTSFQFLYVSQDQDPNEPVSEIHVPIFDSAADEVSIKDTAAVDSDMVGLLWISFFWRDHFLNMLPVGVNGIILVVSTSCNSSFTYEINGQEANFVGWGDHHDPKYDHLEVEATFEELGDYASGSKVYTGLDISNEQCTYTFRTYPSAILEADYTSSDPWIYTAVTVAIFIFTSVVFWIYDFMVERRQKKVMLTAVKSSAIVSSLFPSNVRARLYGMDETSPVFNQSSQKNRLKSFMNDNSVSTTAVETSGRSSNGVLPVGARPIADLFPEVTVMFADISGFTAWSSTREPSQVFILLESLYGEFDKLAARRGVFKVETIGDCYVAVAGLPDPRNDHAVVVVKFARDCCVRLLQLVSKLSVELGPDTEDLTIRFGLNSGPVTAGVLRGEKSRFQLFGDTVNTAARMESTGQPNRIQVTQSTADELIKHNKGYWLHARHDQVEVKGKGRMTTYWVNPRDTPLSGDTKIQHDLIEDIHLHILPDELANYNTGDRISRLVDWNTDILARLIRAIVSRRRSSRIKPRINKKASIAGAPTGGLPIEEVKEIIELPEFDPNITHDDPDSIKLDAKVLSQLRDYVAAIAATYGGSNNPFHNFEHASHVCMSVSKLMSRIVAVDEYYEQGKEGSSLEAFKYKQTFGIASDPLTLFACAFAALIHDADHPGVPNTQLIKEATPVAEKYNNRSVAEQRSVDLSWEMLMDDKFIDLRQTICPTDDEFRRFRQLVVSGVMATDIMDKDLKKLRNERWEKAFDNSVSTDNHLDPNMTREAVNRKATIVIEHLIQASDVAHTMQHWHVFRKWNERLFAEMYQAYKCGRAEKNPAEFWYQGELGFFDFYILPLAKKLSDCGVFGVSSDEYLNYAVKNREEWERKGQAIVAEMLEALVSSDIEA